MSEPSSLLTLVGRMKVHALAQLVNMSVEELVAVLQVPPTHPQADAVPSVVLRPALPNPETEPALAAMLGRATYRELRAVVDLWVFTRAFEECGSDVRIGRRLRINRKTVSIRWARARGMDRETWSTRPGHPIPAPPPPSLSELFERGSDYAAIRQAVERWMFGAVLAHTGGNVLQAVRMLEMPRSQFLYRRARVGSEP